MSTLYRCIVGIASLDGVPFTVVQGTPVTVDGTPMVRLSHGVIVPADGYSPDEATAKARAADEVEAVGRKILEQAQQLRGEGVTA
jgi:hypothetical protein